MSLALKYLESVRKTFDSYKTLGEKAMAQMTIREVNDAVNEDSNSVALIVKHLHGNMLSRWTDFLTTDGEKPWRKRDEEFEGITETVDEVMKTWQAGWQCLFDALSALNENDLEKTVSIRNEKQSVFRSDQSPVGTLQLSRWSNRLHYKRKARRGLGFSYDSEKEIPMRSFFLLQTNFITCE